MKLFKHIAGLLLVISVMGQVKAQDNSYRPFVEEGKSWVIEKMSWWPYEVDEYYIEGDTVVEGQACKKLMLRAINLETDVETILLMYPIFEKNRQVQYYPNGAQEPIMLYDFSAKPGDIVRLGGFENDALRTERFEIVEALTTSDGIPFNGQLANDIDGNVLPHTDEPSFTWVETIGCVLGHSPFAKRPWNDKMGGLGEWLRECRVGNVILYENYDMVNRGKDGDVNGDFIVNGSDITTLYNYLIGSKSSLLRYRCISYRIDVNGDGVVNGSDVTALYNLLLAQ